jgi:hypothetical protein
MTIGSNIFFRLALLVSRLHSLPEVRRRRFLPKGITPDEVRADFTDFELLEAPLMASDSRGLRARSRW